MQSDLSAVRIMPVHFSWFQSKLPIGLPLGESFQLAR